MAKNRHQKLADELKKFQQVIQCDLKIHHKVESEMSHHPFRKVYEEFLSNIWLRCETAQEQRNRKILEASICEQDQKKHKFLYEQYQMVDSQLWKNLRSLVKPIYKNWLFKCLLLTARGERITKYQYPFSPVKKEPLEIALKKVAYFVNTTTSRYLKSLAVSYHQALIKALFNGTHIKVKDDRAFPDYNLYVLR